MSKKTVNQTKIGQNLTLVEWCDQQVNDGHELTLCWDGGNDSGWISLEIDGQSTDDKYSRTLISHLDDELEYGSWAGEFGASGRANYDPDEKAFMGIDNYYETEAEEYKVNIPIKISKHLWFNELNIHIEVDSADQTPQIGVELAIRNGFKTSEYSTVEDDLTIYLKEKVEDVINEYIDNVEGDFNSIWDNKTINYSEGTVKGEYRVFNLQEIEMRYDNTTKKDICLDVTDIELTTINENED